MTNTVALSLLAAAVDKDIEMWWNKDKTPECTRYDKEGLSGVHKIAALGGLALSRGPAALGKDLSREPYIGISILKEDRDLRNACIASLHPETEPQTP